MDKVQQRALQNTAVKLSITAWRFCTNVLRHHGFISPNKVVRHLEINVNNSHKHN